MGSSAEIKEASITGPIASLTGNTYTEKSCGGLRGVVRVATSSTSTAETLTVVTKPDSGTYRPIQGKFLRLKNESTTDSLEFAFGVGGAPTLVYGQAASLASGHASAGWRLAPLEVIDVIVPIDATHLSHILGAAGPSTLAMYCSEGPVGDK